MNTRRTRTVTAYALGAGFVIAAALVAAGCDPGARTGADPAAATGRVAPGEPDKGKVPTGGTGVVTEDRVGQTVAVEARVDQQCPARGCWLRLKDDAGDVMVDLAPNKLELSEDRVGQRAKVTGEVVKKGGRLWLKAEKVEFPPAEKK